MKVVRSGFWRIYFWLFAAITLLSFVVLFIPWIVPAFDLELDAEEFGGALPAELQPGFSFAGAVTNAARQPEAATALLRFLASPDAGPVIMKAGLAPVTAR